MQEWNTAIFRKILNLPSNTILPLTHKHVPLNAKYIAINKILINF